MGACTITGGMFSTDSYSTVRGVDKLIPVDVYLPGCPPKPEAVIDAITKLRKKISREIYEDRIRSQQANRCFTTNHKFHVGRSMNTGNYDQRFLYQPPSSKKTPSLLSLSVVQVHLTRNGFRASALIPCFVEFESKQSPFLEVGMNFRRKEGERKAILIVDYAILSAISSSQEVWSGRSLFRW
ncbi:UNVERIFIED_CONTAM: NAD(P)H-quinone oxidoreductase subunit K, chloroplastic [Sesamum angustifolium]|uniref:NAD(P)H-quinone oxidoreductase subunit K, chloroplastic n=1 Tax=Sesamum angustifolium TaxID=2727405 RepID=A0AAW2KFT6_9LAMI